MTRSLAHWFRVLDPIGRVFSNNTANDPTNNSGPGDFPGGEIRGQIGRR